MRTTIALLLTALLLAALPVTSAFAVPMRDAPAHNSNVVVSDQADRGGGTDWVLVAVLSGCGVLLLVGGRFVYQRAAHHGPPTRPAGTH